MNFKRFVSQMLDGLMVSAVTTFDEPKVFVRRGPVGELRPVRFVKVQSGKIILETK